MHRSVRGDSRWRWKGSLLHVACQAIILGAILATGVSAFSYEELQLAPDFTLPNLDGTEVSLSDYLGKVVILDFWASWCMPCTRSFPSIHELSVSYADRGVELLVLSFDKRAQDARDYLIEHEYPTENVLWRSLKDSHAVRNQFEVSAITHTLVIGPRGYIRYSGHPEKLTAEVLEPWLLDEEDPNATKAVPQEEQAPE